MISDKKSCTQIMPPLKLNAARPTNDSWLLVHLTIFQVFLETLPSMSTTSDNFAKQGGRPTGGSRGHNHTPQVRFGAAWAPPRAPARA